MAFTLKDSTQNKDIMSKNRTAEAVIMLTGHLHLNKFLQGFFISAGSLRNSQLAVPTS